MKWMNESTSSSITFDYVTLNKRLIYLVYRTTPKYV